MHIYKTAKMSQCGDMFVSLSVSGVEITCSGKRIKGIIPMFQVSLRYGPKIEKETTLNSAVCGKIRRN